MAAGIRLNSLKADLKKENEGDWIDVPELPGVRLKVRGLNYGKYQTALNDVNVANYKQFLSKMRNVPPDRVFRNNAKLYHEHILVDWDGFVDDDGEPIPYSKEEAYDILFDPAHRAIHGYIQNAAMLVGELDVEFVDESTKNSSPSSDGSWKEAAE